MAVELSSLTTLRLGGPARRVVEARTEEQLVTTVRELDAAGQPVLLLAGGSNVVAADAGFDGTLVLVRTVGVERSVRAGRVLLEVQAGEIWDELVGSCVREGLQGFECLAGIPGSVGATPIQNVGAYGQEVAETVAGVRVLERASGEVRELSAEDCGFGYRTSTFKREGGHVVLAVRFALRERDESGPLRYGELRTALGGRERAPLAEVRDAVLALRRGKGMVVDPDDPDSVSAGSFFTNPVLSEDEFERLRGRAAERLGSAGAEPPAWREAGGRVKTSAAWLIERAGFERGLVRGAAGISSKHVLALVNRGGATTAELLALAREIVRGVDEAFGVVLVPEPVLVGETW